MRREIFRSDRDRAVAVLRRAPFVHLAGVDDEGRPVGRTLHGVVAGDRLCFHAAPAGEKTALLGKPVVVWCEEVVAEVPSTFSDPERACPATTLYESAQLHGVLERVDDVAAKAAVLQALMERFQPDGGHVPIDAAHPRFGELYANAVRGVLVAGVSLDELDGKSKLLQNRSPADVAAVVEKLWARGRRGDARAVELVLAANPAVPRPAFLAAPAGVRFHAAVVDDAGARACEAASLLESAYWNAGVPADAIRRAHLGATAWVIAVDDEGRLAASARALSDGAKWATVYDVVVREELRGRGIGSALVKLLLAHPALRRCLRVNLRTRDAQPVYAKLGFVERSPVSTEMLLVRGESTARGA